MIEYAVIHLKCVSIVMILILLCHIFVQSINKKIVVLNVSTDAFVYQRLIRFVLSCSIYFLYNPTCIADINIAPENKIYINDPMKKNTKKLYTVMQFWKDCKILQLDFK